MQAQAWVQGDIFVLLITEFFEKKQRLRSISTKRGSHYNSFRLYFFFFSKIKTLFYYTFCF